MCLKKPMTFFIGTYLNVQIMKHAIILIHSCRGFTELHLRGRAAYDTGSRGLETEIPVMTYNFIVKISAYFVVFSNRFFDAFCRRLFYMCISFKWAKGFCSVCFSLSLSPSFFMGGSGEERRVIQRFFPGFITSASSSYY